MIFADPLDLVRFARTHCPYYRDLYRDLPDEPRFGDVPPVDVPRYWATKAEDFDSTLTRTPPDGYLWTTGGSTLQSKRVAVSAEDFAEEARAFGAAFLAAGMTAGDRVANLTWAGELSASFILTSRALEQLPVFQLPILGHTTPSRVVDLCRELRPTVLLTFPFVAARVANHLFERGETLPVDKLLFAGDRLYPDQRALLTRAFVPRVIAPFGYGAVDCGPIAAVDRTLGEDVYRPLAGYSLVEILDDHGRPAPLGETGRLTITNLGRTLSPVIRYSPGDMGSWVVLPEPDGRGGAFRLKQRDHLSIKVSFGIAAHADIVREAAAIEGLSSIVQLVARRKDGCDWLVVRVVPTSTGEAAERAGQLLLARLRTLFPALRDPEGAKPSPRLLVELCAANLMELTIAGKNQAYRGDSIAMNEEDAPRVVARAGTDGSYDLVVLVVTPRPEGTVSWRGDAGVPPRRKEEIARAVEAQFGAECEARGVGLTLCFYQRLPDPFVITARVKAALHAKEP